MGCTIWCFSIPDVSSCQIISIIRCHCHRRTRHSGYAACDDYDDDCDGDVDDGDPYTYYDIINNECDDDAIDEHKDNYNNNNDCDDVEDAVDDVHDNIDGDDRQRPLHRPMSAIDRGIARFRRM